MVEFAVTLPVLLLILTGLATFGVGMNNYLQLTEATSVGARQLAISRQQTNDPCSVVSTAVMAAAPNLTSSSMSFSYLLNGVSYSGTSCSSGSPTTGAAANLVQGKFLFGLEADGIGWNLHFQSAAVSLNGIFASIASDLSTARLIPNNTT